MRLFRRWKRAKPDRLATLNLPDAKLQGYLFAQALADGQRIDCNDILRSNRVDDLFVGMALTIGALRNLIANDNGLSLEEVDEQLIDVLPVSS